MRRRQRRLRSWLRRERMTVAMALAEKTHHTAPRRPKMARAGKEGHEEYDAPRRQKPPPPHPELFSLYEEEPGGVRPGSVTDPVPQERVQRHSVEHRIEACPFVQILGAPVPQGSDQLVEAFRHVDLLTPGQVIEVPMISSSSRRSRRVRTVPQTAEQLVEVPTDPGDALAVLASKVISRRELRGVLSRQGSTESGAELIVDVPGPRGGLQGFRSRQNSTASDVEQIVDIPARNRGLQGFRPGQNSTAFGGAEQFRVVEVFTVYAQDRFLLLHPLTHRVLWMRFLQVFFALFTVREKVRGWVRTRGRNLPQSRAHPRGVLMARPRCPRRTSRSQFRSLRWRRTATC